MHFSDFKYLIQGLVQLPKAIQADGIIRFFFISGLISILIGVVILGSSWLLGDDLGIKLISLIPWKESKNWSDTIGIWLGRILVLAIGIILYKHLVINITSQFLGGINDRIMENHKENLRPYKNPIFTASLQRGIQLSLRNLFLELFVTIILIILGTILPIIIITTPLIFLIQSYFAGFGITDLFLEKYMKASESIHWNRKHKILTIGIGAIFMGLLIFPIIGLLLAPGLAVVVCSRAMVQIPEFRKVK